MADALYTLDITNLDEHVDVVRMEGREAMSELFQFQVTFVCPNPSLGFDQVVGRPALLTMRLGEEPRHVHGIVCALEQGDQGHQRTQYRALIVPELWRANEKQNFCIFQELTAVEIIAKVLDDLGLTAGAYELALQSTYETREYCVQYRESDWAFINRLMEEEGMYCFFEHSDGGHTLVIADGASAHPAIAGDGAVPFRADTGALEHKEHVHRFRYREEIRPDRVTLRDYDFKRPHLSLEAEVEADATTNIEVYDYPGDYETPGVGSTLAQLRLERWRVAGKIGSGASTTARLIAGHTFDLIDHGRDDFNRGWFVLGVEHRGQQPISGEADEGDVISYENTFRCMPSDVPFRPLPMRPKPTINGVQTAIVTGPSGEEIHTDEHGRIKVQFHWDREGKSDENSSCWIRVAQVWAGPGWGGLYIPRIGQEVIVEFLEGDPDRPLVTGTVYHGTNVPPYVLPEDKTKSTLKSNSSIGGDGYNELRFEDLKGKEEIFLHGQKDWTIAIENDKNQTVGHDETLKVGNDRSKEIGRDQSEKVGRDQSIEVDGEHSEKIAGSQTIEVGGSAIYEIEKDRTKKIGGSQTITIGKDHTSDVGGDHTEGITGKMTLSVGKDLSLSSDGVGTMAIKKDHTLQVDGSHNVEVKKDMATGVGGSATTEVGKEKTITVGDKLSLEVGDGKVTIEKDGTITVEGKDITVKGSGTINVEGEKVQIKSKGAVDVKADGDVKIKGSGIGLN